MDRSTDGPTQQQLLDLVQAWLDGSIATDAFEASYWPTRRRLLQSDPTIFTGFFGEAMSAVDLAVDAMSDDDRVIGSIPEHQARREVAVAMDQLRHLAPNIFPQ